MTAANSLHDIAGSTTITATPSAAPENAVSSSSPPRISTTTARADAAQRTASFTERAPMPSSTSPTTVRFSVSSCMTTLRNSVDRGIGQNRKRTP